MKAADGHELHAYIALPAGAPRAALVVVQEVFGVNSHIRGVCDGWAKDGYLAIAPALFDRIRPGLELGYEAADLEQGRAWRAQVGNENALLDIDAARAHGSKAGLRVGIVGYCWGGLLSWLAACKLDGFAAAVTYYGGGMPDHADLSPRCPVQSHFGDRDGFIPVDRVVQFAAAHPEVELHRYPADHGFNCEQRASYDAPSAALARERASAFFASRLT